MEVEIMQSYLFPSQVPSGSQSAAAPEQKITNLNSTNQTTTYVVNHVTQQNSYDANTTNDDSIRNAPSLFIDLQGLDDKPSSGNSPIKSTPEIPIQNPVIANLKASGAAYPPPVNNNNAPIANSPPQQSFMNPNQISSSQHNSRTGTPINSGTPINTPPTSLTVPLQKASLMQGASNTSPVQMQPAPITLEQLQNNLQALGISPAQNGQWTMNANSQLTTILSALGQQQNVPLANVTAAQLTGQQANPGLSVAPQTLQVAPQQMVASNGVGLMPSTSAAQVVSQVQVPQTPATVQQVQQAAQVQQLQQAIQAQQQVAQVPQVSQVAQVPVVQQQHVVPQHVSQVQQTQQLQQAQMQQMQQAQQQVQLQQAQQQTQMQQAQQAQQHAQMQQVAQLQQNGQLNQNQAQQQPPNGMAVLQQDGTMMTPAYGAALMNSAPAQLQFASMPQLNTNQIPQMAMYASNPVQQNVNVAALEHQLQADTLTLMMQMMKTMGELNKRMANLENEVESLRGQVRQHQQQNMQLQQTLMTVQQQQPISGAQNPNETGQEDKTRANRTNSTAASNSNQIMSLNEAPPVNSLGTNPRPGVVNSQYYQAPQSPYYYTTTNNGMAYVQPMATTGVPMPVPVGAQVPGYPGQMYYYTTAQQPTAVQGQQRYVYTNQRQ
eukprot:TRINITY_DN2026_c0_g1_i2.p1 TRINITY_DN2026_c0_g1~~TRINITY_DN2026_c0_g1_i2.p1  ORF type:complete len:661 (-),score=166.20 TRINITY_DN2026_c0_g1_i2:147-2129(-)